MIVLFYNNESITIRGYNSLCIIHKESGIDLLEFSLDQTIAEYTYFIEERLILCNNNYWIVKTISDDNITCELYLDFLRSDLRKQVSYCNCDLQTILTDVFSHHAGWRIVYRTQIPNYTASIELPFCTDMDIISECAENFFVRFNWNNRDKVVYVTAPELVEPSGQYLTKELNLVSESYTGDSRGIATRLYAYGKNGMSIDNAVVNGQAYGKEYVEDYSYTDKVICTHWSDERYTVPENLYKAAVRKLSEMSSPKRSYECRMSDLSRVSDEYSFLAISIHAKVILVDSKRGRRIVLQVVEYKEYPDEPYMNEITLSTCRKSIAGSIKSLERRLDKETAFLQQQINNLSN